MNDIKITSISKKYQEKEVLKNFDATIKSGKVNCIFAPSGAGKTTLLRILMQLESIDSGSISGLENLRMSAIFQEDRLCETLTASKNISIVVPYLSQDTILHAMQQVGLADCAFQPISELSGGMKRRIAILRALLCEYDIIFLDEPFKGLDVKTKKKVIAYVNRSVADKTVILVTHDLDEAEAMHTDHFLFI